MPKRDASTNHEELRGQGKSCVNAGPCACLLRFLLHSVVLQEFTELVHARARRRMSRGLKRKPMAFIKRLRKAKKSELGLVTVLPPALMQRA